MKEKDLVLTIFFKWAWKYKPVYCQCGCKKKLPVEMSIWCMDHLLEKNKYPECKYSLKNIFFCTTDCHTHKTKNKIKKMSSIYIEAIATAHMNKRELEIQSKNFQEKIISKLKKYGKS